MSYRSPRPLARFAKVGLGAVVLTELMLALALGAQAAVLGVPIEQAPPGDAATGLVGLGMCCSGLGSVGALIAAATLFLMWLHRAYSGAHAMDAGLTYSPGYAVGAWFIPFVNLVVPMQIVQALDAATTPDTQLESMVRSRDTMAWWILWIGSSVVGGVFSRLGEELGPTVVFVAHCFILVMRLGAAVLLVRIIARITDNLDRMAQRAMPGSVEVAPLTF